MGDSVEGNALLSKSPISPIQEEGVPTTIFTRSRSTRLWSKAVLITITGLILYCTFGMLFDNLLLIITAGTANSAAFPGVPGGKNDNLEALRKTSSDVPQYFQTTPELWAGPTETGRAPFLAQTNAVSFDPTATFVPNTPLETAIPIVGQQQNQSIFHLMGQLSPYFPNPSGFGVAEYPLPPGANITQVHMLSRHGSRYPTTGANVYILGQKIANLTGKFQASGQLSFLNEWKYELGREILVPRGRQELFESGILHYYEYGQLYNPNSKIIVRTTTQDRMLKSAEYFMAGFFGLEWTNNATIEVIIEAPGFNNSLAGYDNCKNANTFRNKGGANATTEWVKVYLKDATERLKPLIKGFEWTIEDTYAAQNMCPYETVAYGYSVFCDLFTYDEWVGFEYSLDLYFAGSSSFQSPTGRAVGLGYVQETVARLKNHTLGYSGSQINTTLDSNEETFPLNQTLYFDFSHDTNIMSILTAFGFRQFNTFLPATHYVGPHNLTVSHLEPFGARLDIEIIKTPSPLNAKRKYEEGEQTTYIHFLLNQRTLPLGLNFAECGDRLDGWCELKTFLKTQEKAEELAKYDYACNGDYDAVPYGQIVDGAPI
ncbi:probable 3-phytase A precursor [Rhynchosporium secalis]|uniref:3-phytase n=1 Tax=Rhynchosporium secalis TaxID=38038 RepID=A0A1E1M0T4_RHYSE|nr:probable 3-phytase A precursor [Rhynchosporium secalis]